MLIGSHKNFGSFSALGCGHCKKAKPEFMDAAKHDAENSKVNYCYVFLLKLSRIILRSKLT